MQTKQQFFLLGCAFIISACHSSGHSIQVDTSQETKHIDIQSLIKMTSKSCQTSQQCNATGVGHSACGGFAHYLIYSDQTASIEKLKATILKVNLQAKQDSKTNRKSAICLHLKKPVVQCISHQCSALSSDSL